MTRDTDRPVAIVTGASRSQGRAIALRLAREGYDLSLAARSEEAMRDLQQDLANEGAYSLVTAVDLTDCEERKVFVARTLAEMGRVDILVNNAAVSSLVKFVDAEWEDVSHQIDLNLEAPMHLSHLVLGDMVNRGSGKIVNISSIATSASLPVLTTYRTTRSGLEYFTKALRSELEGTGVSVTAVLPSGIADPRMTKSLEAGSGVRLEGAVAMGIVSATKIANDVVAVIKNDKVEKALVA